MTEVLTSPESTLISYHEELVRRARLGEEHAVHAIYEDVLPTVARVAARYERHPLDRPDHIQNGIERLLRAYVLPPPEGEPEEREPFKGNLRALAGTITRNVIYDSLRRQTDNEGSRIEISDSQYIADASPAIESVESAVLDNSMERIDTLLNASGCTEEMAAALKLRYVASLSVKEVAEIMDCPVGTVLSRSKRGLEHVKKYFGITKESPVTDIFVDIPEKLISESAQ